MELDDYADQIVSGDDLLLEVINLYPEVLDFFYELGMHCVGCESASFESVRDACRAHGLNPMAVVRELNNIIAGCPTWNQEAGGEEE